MSSQPLSSILSRFSLDVAKVAEDVYGNETPSVLEDLTKPVATYYVRCNTLKISSEELQNRLEEKGFKVHRHPIISEALGILVEGPFDIPSAERKIVVDKRTAESVLQGANVYAPGILNCEFLRVGDEVVVVSELGDELATGTAIMGANDILTFRKGLAVRVNHRRFRAPQIRELPEFSQGLLYPQSLAAMVTGRVLDPHTNETIVDMNCAPGGKLSHLAQLMHNSGRILGFDRNSDKLTLTRQTIIRLGCLNVTLSIQDTRYLHLDSAGLQADRILIDPPCSALGLRPKTYDFTTMERVNNLANYQKQFIKAGSKVLKTGGTMVYSVCTFTRQECEGVVEFAEHECGLNLVEQKPFLGSKDLSNFAPPGLCQRFHPNLDEIGYFIAKFER